MRPLGEEAIPDWRNEGRCALPIHDPDLWTPDTGREYDTVRRAAKQICNGREGQSPCAARVDCLLWSIETEQFGGHTGIWGGQTPRERRRFRKGGHTRCGHRPDVHRVAS